MTEIFPCDSDDEFFAEIDAAREAADARVVPWQVHVRAGDLALSFNHDLEGWVGVEILDALHGADADERKYLAETYGAPEMKHYRFARAFSPVCPDGELGDVHVSTLACLVPREAFDAARAADWGGSDPRTLLAQLAIWAPQIEALCNECLARGAK